MILYEEFQAEVRRLRRERWAGILDGEPSGRVPGRRPRDPEQEALLLALDRARLGLGPVTHPQPGCDPDATGET